MQLNFDNLKVPFQIQNYPDFRSQKNCFYCVYIYIYVCNKNIFRFQILLEEIYRFSAAPQVNLVCNKYGGNRMPALLHNFFVHYSTEHLQSSMSVVFQSSFPQLDCPTLSFDDIIDFMPPQIYFIEKTKHTIFDIIFIESKIHFDIFDFMAFILSSDYIFNLWHQKNYNFSLKNLTVLHK